MFKSIKLIIIIHGKKYRRNPSVNFRLSETEQNFLRWYFFLPVRIKINKKNPTSFSD